MGNLDNSPVQGADYGPVESLNMQPKNVYAILTEPSGSVLLIKRRSSALWGLPGGIVRPSSRLEDLLVTYCQRQVGIAPDFQEDFEEIVFAETPIKIALAEVPKVRAGARGRVDSVSWVNPASPPYEMEPAARMIVGLLACSDLVVPVSRVEIVQPWVNAVTA